MSATRCPERDKNFVKLVEALESCSGENDLECDSCSYRQRCQKWWSAVSERASHRSLKAEDYKQGLSEFEMIKNGKGWRNAANFIKTANKN